MRNSGGFLLLETILYLALSASFILLVHGCVSGLLASLQTTSNQLRLAQQHAAAQRLLATDLRSASCQNRPDDLRTGMFITKRVDGVGALLTQQIRWWVDQKGVVRRAVHTQEAGKWVGGHSSVIAQGCTALVLRASAIANDKVKAIQYTYQTTGGMAYEATIALHNA